MFKFIHCADLHLGSPFSGRNNIPPDEVRKLVLAPFDAFDRLVDRALEEEVLFMVISGDVADSGSLSIYGESRFRAALERLNAAKIEVFIALGNHDCGLKLENLPPLVHIFSAENAELFKVKSAGIVAASIAGISHKNPGEKNDLAPAVEDLLKGDDVSGLKVAVLHANIDGVPGHEPYAPLPLDELRRSCAACWALGHIHGRRILSNEPLVLYSGSIQGRSVNESGCRGGWLIEADGCRIIRTVEVDVQQIRFETLTLDKLAGVSDINALGNALFSALPETDDKLMLRIILSGECMLNRSLRASKKSDLEEFFAPILRRKLPQAQIESVVVNTRGCDSSSRREGLASLVSGVRDEVDPAEELLRLAIAPQEFAGFPPQEFAAIKDEAEELLLDYLCGDLESGK